MRRSEQRRLAREAAQDRAAQRRRVEKLAPLLLAACKAMLAAGDETVGWCAGHDSGGQMARDDAEGWRKAAWGVANLIAQAEGRTP